MRGAVVAWRPRVLASLLPCSSLKEQPITRLIKKRVGHIGSCWSQDRTVESVNPLAPPSSCSSLLFPWLLLRLPPQAPPLACKPPPLAAQCACCLLPAACCGSEAVDMLLLHILLNPLAHKRSTFLAMRRQNAECGKNTRPSSSKHTCVCLGKHTGLIIPGFILYLIHDTSRPHMISC